MVDQRHPAQSVSDEAAPAGWPPGVVPISMDGLDHLGVGNDGRLYWDGKSVEVSQTFSLTWWQRIGAVLVSASAVIGALAAVATAIADWRH